MALTTSPLFRDPVEDGAADPTVIYNRQEGAWWMVYTNRRASAPFEDGLAWLFGSALGVASSPDGVHWDYRGTLGGLEVEWGLNTFWAPEIVEHDGTYHMYVSYIRGVPAAGAAHSMVIRHYTSPDLVHWTHQGVLPLGSSRIIDACVHPLPTGGFRLWYKDQDRGGGQTWSADSDDLVTWRPRGLVVETPGGHEGPNVFFLGGSYWLLVDTWSGQAVYRSEDLESWTPAGTVLEGHIGQRFARADDVGPGLHGDVVSDGERAWIFYFTHPDRTERAHPTALSRRSSILVAELVVVDGQLRCDRDADVDLDLRPPRAAPGWQDGPAVPGASA